MCVARGGAAGNEAHGATRMLREMAARGDRDVLPLLQKFRHHCRFGLDIRAARWDEDRDFVAELLCNWPASAAVEVRPAYEQARAEALSRLSARKRKSFNRKLDRLRTFVWLREEMRDLSSRMYYLIRRYVLEIARRRGIGDDIFLMTFREIFADDRSNVARCREVYESYRHFKAPNEIGVRFAFDSRPYSRGAARDWGKSRNDSWRSAPGSQRRGGDAPGKGRDSRLPVHRTGVDSSAGSSGGCSDGNGWAAFPRRGDLPRVRHSCRARCFRGHATYPRRENRRCSWKRRLCRPCGLG